MTDLTIDWKNHLAQVMQHKPRNNALIESKRGQQVAKIMIDFDRETFPWKRSDVDTFWIDVQLMTKYLLTDEEIKFTCNMQSGIDNYKKYKEERDAYSMIKRGFHKLREAEKRRNK